jgi:hypothetical protein
MLTAYRNATHLAVRIHTTCGSSSNKPISIGFAIDTSGSMEGERLSAVKRTLRAAAGLWQPRDRVTLVTFGDEATVVTDQLQMDEAGQIQFYEKVAAIHTSGCTNMGAGFDTLRGRSYDGVVLLTDGVVNVGDTTTAGLSAKASSLGSLPFTALGYGADHNRALLNRISLKSRGAYIYVNNDEMLPEAMGDLIGGLRTELYKDATLRLSAPGALCAELDSEVDRTTYRVGTIIPNRDYWVVYEVPGDREIDEIVLEAPGLREVLGAVPISDCVDLQVQVLRCRVVKMIAAATASLEQGLPLGPGIAALRAEMAVLPSYVLERPLVQQMRAQLAEIVERPAEMADMMARMSSNTTYLSSQRGVTSRVSAASASDPVAPPPFQSFSSPVQRAASQQTQTNYSASDPTD